MSSFFITFIISISSEYFLTNDYFSKITQIFSLVIFCLVLQFFRNPKRKIWRCILSEEIHPRRFIDEALHLPSTYNHFNRWQTRFALYVTPDDANKQQTSVKRSAVVSQRPRWFPQQAMIIYGLTGASCRPEAFMQESPHCIFFSQHCLDLFFLGRARAHQPLVGWIVFFCPAIPNNRWSKPPLQRQWRATCAIRSSKLSFGPRRSHTCMHLSNSWLHGRCQTFRLLFLTWTGILCWKSQTSHLVAKW